MNERYSWAGGEELLHLSPGRNSASVIGVLPPFEEANRTRALLSTILRDLNARGFATALPDLPGQGESPLATGRAGLDDWRRAFAAAVAGMPGQVHVVAVRGGALIDAEAAVASRWYLAPQDGAALSRELARLTDAAGLMAGNRLAPDLLAQLADVAPPTQGTVRTVRLLSDTAAADLKLEGAPLWRRAEPDNDVALAGYLALDIAEWIAACAA